MKRIIAIAAFALAMLPAAAQETYENAKIGWSDLNGTARYVGMGGAMEALGADISTIGTNPAGIGLFRKSQAYISLGVVSQQDGNAFGGGHTTNMSFDQVGFVYASRTSPTGFLNFGFNYHKSRNFNYILSAADNLYHASQNKASYIKEKYGQLFELNGNGDPDFGKPLASCNQLDDIYDRAYYGNQNVWWWENDEVGNTYWFYDNKYEADSYTMNRRHWGYIGDYDFNLSGNINNRVYLGMTIGVHDVHYKHYSEYTELKQTDKLNMIQVADDREIEGTGADIKLGLIFRPIETSPFRIGLSVATPTWYNLTTRNNTNVGDGYGSTPCYEEYEFKLYTPWKFGVSAGTTFGSYLALGASYEYTDYGTMDTRYKTGSHYNWWSDGYYEESESDEVMNRHTADMLKGVSTLKLGAEFKAAPEVAVRFGYNYVSPMYQKDGFKDGTLKSDGSYYSSATDFTNWEAMHRITCGVGFQIDKVNLSASYQYATQNGYFEPFTSTWENDEKGNMIIDHHDNNIADAVKVSNKRHQLLLTATYSF